MAVPQAGTPEAGDHGSKARNPHQPLRGVIAVYLHLEALITMGDLGIELVKVLQGIEQ